MYYSAEKTEDMTRSLRGVLTVVISGVVTISVHTGLDDPFLGGLAQRSRREDNVF